ncbi:PFKFB2 [Symbiodinium microadriaticum]|nr:PFKFB2 [Symbiodinium microadriaticum]
MKYLQESKRIREDQGELETPEGANLLRSIGVVCAEQQDIDRALETCNEARCIRELSAFLRKCRREMEEAGQVETSGDILVLMGTAPVHYSTLQAMMMRGSSPNLTSDLNGEFTPGGALHCKGFQAMSTSLLNELDGGVCNGLSYAEIQQDYPDLWGARERDKLNFRYPNGESYKDVIGRLRPIIIELERQRRSILVISHLAVQRCLYAYFTGTAMEEIPFLEMDMHTVAELRPGAFDCEVRTVKLWETSPECPTPLK